MNEAVEKRGLFTQLWKIYYPYWPAYLLTAALMIAAAWLYLQKQPRLYEANAAILIKDEKKGLDDSKMIESLNLISNKKIMENEIEVITGRSLMREVVDSLGLYAPVYEKGSWKGNLLYANTPIRVKAKSAAAVKPAEAVMFSFDNSKHEVAIGNARYPTEQWVQTQYGELKFAETGKPGRTGQLYFQLIDPKLASAALLSKLKVTASSKMSTVIDLSVKEQDPELAENILFELIEAYNRHELSDKNNLATTTLGFLQKRLDDVGHILDSIEQKINLYKANRGAVDIGQQSKLYLESVSSSDQKLAELNVQLAVLEKVEDHLLSKRKGEAIVPSTFGVSDPILTGLLEKLYTIELEKNKMQATTGENSPLMLAVNGQINQLTPIILDNVKSQRAALLASKSKLSSVSQGYSSALQGIPQKERDLIEISRQQNIESSIYSFLLQKREEAELSYSSTVVSNKIVDIPEASPIPVSPKGMIVYAAAGIIGLLLGIFIVTLRESFNKKVMYSAEIEALSSIPIIGEISFDKNETGLVLVNHPRSVVSEQFRRLRVSLGSLGVNFKRKKIMVTSSISGDGKSFISTNLALAMAKAGKRVVLIEADITNPGISGNFSLSFNQGLAEYLAGHLEIENIIKKVEVTPNLFIVPAGTLELTPSDAMANDRMSELIRYLEDVFDFLIVDTAPVGALTDAYVMAPNCDATIFVIRHGVTPKMALERLDKMNKLFSLNNVGIVFNGVKNRGFVKNNYDAGYGSVYTYERR